MKNGVVANSDLLRVIGFTGVGVGLAWAAQLLGAGKPADTIGQLLWMLGAAVIAGAGTGTLYAAASLRDPMARAPA